MATLDSNDLHASTRSFSSNHFAFPTKSTLDTYSIPEGTKTHALNHLGFWREAKHINYLGEMLKQATRESSFIGISATAGVTDKPGCSRPTVERCGVRVLVSFYRVRRGSRCLLAEAQWQHSQQQQQQPQTPRTFRLRSSAWRSFIFTPQPSFPQPAPSPGRLQQPRACLSAVPTRDNP